MPKSGPTSSVDREQGIEAIVADLLATGELADVDVDSVVRQHPHLEKELRERLRWCRAILNAAESARNGSTSLASGDGNSLKRPLIDDLQICDELPGYQILERVRYGGQGVVYKARQLATKRVVAIKLLLDGPMATSRQRQRFEREVQLIARLRHPNIVTVYDSGVAGGRHYVAMEFVQGLPIDDYALFHGLDTHAIVSIFRQVCLAITTAHQKGIIHRDLKPSNILVDADGVPHVLDFGLAKDVAETDDVSRLSMSGQVIGTLPYLSPEQACGAVHEVDVRSDIYALGVLLYELITQTTPYPVNGNALSTLTNIVQREPTPPRLAAMVHEDRSAPAHQGLNDDLERIMLKCLEKRPTDRYQSAAALTDDLDCYLRGDAVAARAVTGFYQLRKKLHRHRAQISVLGAFTVVCVAALLIATVMWHRADAAARIAQAGLQMGSYLKLGSVDRDDGRVDQAIFMFTKAVEAAELADQSDPFVQRQHFDARYRLADLLLSGPQPGDAALHVRRAIEIADGLLNKQPDNTEWLRLLGFAHRLQGRLAFTRHEWPAAIAAYRTAIDVRRRLLTRDPENLSFQLELANVLGLLGDAMRSSGSDIVEMNQVYQSAYETCNSALAKDPDWGEAQIERIRAAARLAAAYAFSDADEHRSLAWNWLERADEHIKMLPISVRTSRSRDVAGLEAWVRQTGDALHATRTALSTTSD